MHNNDSYTYDGEKIVFDGKRMRRAVFRKTVDYNSSIYKLLKEPESHSVLGRLDVVQADINYIINLMTPCMFQANPAWLATTNLSHISTNKVKYHIKTAVWTPEGRRLITGSQGGEFTLWNGATFNFETILQAHEHPICSMTWSRSENILISGDAAGIIKYWQPNLNNLQAFVGHKESVCELSFSPGDFKFASCSNDSTIKIWDFLQSGEELELKGHGWDVLTVQWHPTHNLLASGSKDTSIRLWDPRSGKCLTTIHSHKYTVNDLKWNNNGIWLLSASKDNLIKLHDIRMLKELQVFKGHSRDVNSISWHPQASSTFVSGGGDGSLIFSSVGYNDPISIVEKAHDYTISSLSWHPIGHCLASGSMDCTTRFWTRPRPYSPENTDSGLADNSNTRPGKPASSLPGFYSSH